MLTPLQIDTAFGIIEMEGKVSGEIVTEAVSVNPQKSVTNTEYVVEVIIFFSIVEIVSVVFHKNELGPIPLVAIAEIEMESPTQTIDGELILTPTES